MRSARRTSSHTAIAAIRKEKGIHQDEFARRVGISRAALQRLESGETYNPGIRTLLGCAEVLQVPLDAIIEDRWRPQPTEPTPPPER